jgi:hypothetical protein
MIFRKYSFQKLTHFSMENNALDIPAPDTHGVVSRNSCVPST